MNGSHVFIAAGSHERVAGGPIQAEFKPSDKIQRAMEAHKGGSLAAQRIADKPIYFCYRN